MSGMKVIRGVAGVIVLLLLLFVVLNWFGDYRDAAGGSDAGAKGAGSTETTSTSETGDTSSETQEPPAEERPADETAAAKGVLVVEVDGLNFRKAASGDSAAMRGLKKGERVDLLEDLGDWFRVRDKDGTVGYITSNSSYTRSVE